MRWTFCDIVEFASGMNRGANKKNTGPNNPFKEKLGWCNMYTWNQFDFFFRGLTFHFMDNMGHLGSRYI